MKHYDIFISYAREDSGWVQEHLYQPLLRCKMPNGQRPHIFIDIDEIKVGQAWADVLMRAIQNTRHFIPVYTSTYFKKPMCEWEMKLAWNRDPAGSSSILMPILLDPAAQVPEIYQMIQYTTADHGNNWFDELFSSVFLFC